jgi:alkylation response protein AidB-like acyl-CoA dehydrogenase
MGRRGAEAGRVYFREVRVPVESLIGAKHGAYEIFTQMIIPEWMTSASGQGQAHCLKPTARQAIGPALLS